MPAKPLTCYITYSNSILNIYLPSAGNAELIMKDLNSRPPIIMSDKTSKKVPMSMLACALVERDYMHELACMLLRREDVHLSAFALEV